MNSRPCGTEARQLTLDVADLVIKTLSEMKGKDFSIKYSDDNSFTLTKGGGDYHIDSIGNVIFDVPGTRGYVIGNTRELHNLNTTLRAVRTTLRKNKKRKKR